MRRSFSRLSAGGAWLGAWLVPAVVLASPAAHDEHEAGIEWVTPILGNDGKTGLLWILINFAVLLWILEKLLFKGLRTRTAEKSDRIKTELERASAARQEAEDVMSDVRGRLDKLETEVESILAEAKARGEADRERIIEAAKREAERIEAAAHNTALREAEARRRQLEGEIVEQAVARATTLLRERLDGAQQRRLAEEFVGQIARVSMPGTPGAPS